MNGLRRFLVFALLGTGACGRHVDPAPSPAAAFPGGTLYERLGGYDALAAVTDDFLGRWLDDPQIGPIFDDLDADGKLRVRQMVVDQLCAVTGGPCHYVGLPMRAAHEGLGITGSDWTVAEQHLLATFDAFRIPTRERTELIGILRRLRPDVVEEPE